MSGTFIVIDGPDGSGSSKQSLLLHERMQAEGMESVLTSEPTDGAIGKSIRELTKEVLPECHCLQLLFCADRAQHVAEVIKPALEAGKTVICDRYHLSSVIYGGVDACDEKWLEQIGQAFPKPDLTIITLPPFEVCQERLARRDHHDAFEKVDFQKLIYEEYAKQAGPDIWLVDTNNGLEDTAEEIWQELKSRDLLPTLAPAS